MHKQLLSTAFAAFLALALTLCIVTPMAERGEETEAPASSAQSEEHTGGGMTETEATAPPLLEDNGTETDEETAPTEVTEEPCGTEAVAPPSTEPISTELPEGAESLSLYINGRATEPGLCFAYEGRIWLPVRGFGELFGYGNLDAEAGKSYIISGDRAIPCSKRDAEVCVIDCGEPYAPIEPLLSAAGLRATEIIGNEICIWGVPTFPEAKDIYSEEDLYWLSRIISAEARGEPFIGQLAVGTVVINRTGSKYYPDSIYEVIFDRLGGVQFTPTSTGSIYREPTESSVLAAKLCLEGFSLDDGILFFFNSRIAAGSWITANRTYTMTVGRHDFYS